MSEMVAAAPRARPGDLAFRIGVIASLLFLFVGFASIVWTPYDVASLNVGIATQDMSAEHWLGTDQLGRDVASLLMKGLLTSFVVAAVAVFIGALVGVPLGLAAAAWGGPAQRAILGVEDFFVAFPALVIAILITTLAGPGTLNVMIALGLANVPVFARIACDGAVRVRAVDYVAAARLAGDGGWEIARRHVLPNIAGVLVAQALVLLGIGVIAEAGFAYVGLGAQPPATSLGLMLRDAQGYLALKPALALIPGVAIVLVVIALNLAADGLRRLTDPRLAPQGATRGAA